jgi:hypothetical protein
MVAAVKLYHFDQDLALNRVCKGTIIDHRVAPGIISVNFDAPTAESLVQDWRGGTCGGIDVVPCEHRVFGSHGVGETNHLFGVTFDYSLMRAFCEEQAVVLCLQLLGERFELVWRHDCQGEPASDIARPKGVWPYRWLVSYMLNTEQYVPQLVRHACSIGIP